MHFLDVVSVVSNATVLAGFEHDLGYSAMGLKHTYSSPAEPKEALCRYASSGAAAAGAVEATSGSASSSIQSRRATLYSQNPRP